MSAAERRCSRCGRVVRCCFYRDGTVVEVDPEPTEPGVLVVLPSGLITNTGRAALGVRRGRGRVGFVEHAQVCRPVKASGRT